MPTCRMPPPQRLRMRRACAMTSPGPTRIDPIGAPSPFEKHIISVSAQAAQSRTGMPVAISFTVETDGRLPTGQELGAAIREVDDATERYPSYYMVNCAHPTHFADVLSGEWTKRIQGLRANASCRSHAELNEAADLDIGDPAELASLYARLRREGLPKLNVMGGCCGTDHRHVEAIAHACVGLMRE